MHALFIAAIAHEGEDIVIQGIICLIGAISHPVLFCQMAVFPWSLPVFTVTCRGGALSGTEGLRTQQWRSISVPVWSFGAYLLQLSRLLPPARLAGSFAGCPRCCAWCSWPRSRTDKANWKRRLLSADRLWQQWLARGGCATPCREFSQQNNSAVVKNTRRATITREACQGSQMNFADWRKRGKPTLSAVWLKGGGLCQRLVKSLTFHSRVEWKETTKKKQKEEELCLITDVQSVILLNYKIKYIVYQKCNIH